MKKIISLSLKNFMSISEMQMTAGQALTKISGQNAKGKTAILKAFEQVYSGSHNAELIKEGTKSAEIGIVFEGGKRFTRTINSKRSTSKLFDENGRQEKTPKQGLKDLIDLVSGNPIDFLKMPEKDIIAVILGMIDIPLQEEKINDIIKSQFKDQLNYDDCNNNIDGIDLALKEVMEERKFLKRKNVDLQGHIETISESIVVNYDETEIQNRKQENQKLLETAIDKKLEYQDKFINKFNEEFKQLEHQKIELRNKMLTMEIEKDATLLKIKEKFNEASLTYKTEIEKADNELTLAYGASKLIESKKESEIQSEKFETTIDAMTDIISELRNYKLAECKHIPVDGLELKDRKIYFNDVHFSLINEAQRLEIGVKLSKYRNPENKVMLIDGIEAMDKENQEQLFKLADLNGLQLFVTEVNENEELTIMTKD